MNAFNRKPRGFTLIELLAVLAITAILASLAIGVVPQIQRGLSLDTAETSLAGGLNQARQAASTHNVAIQVRFYQAGGSSNYNAFRFFEETTSGTVPLTKVDLLPSGTVILTSQSNIVSSTGGTPSVSGTATSLDTPIAAGVAYAGFTIRPTGETDLGTNWTTQPASWYLTVVNSNAPIGGAGLPQNYVTIAVNPYTANTSIYRP
jgi:uncharacterized protein (TIGR02596 family)